MHVIKRERKLPREEFVQVDRRAHVDLAKDLLAGGGGGRRMCRWLAGVPAKERGVLALVDREDCWPRGLPLKF